MTNREKEIELINKTQDEYENILIDYLLKPHFQLKTINFTSPTGTGKTKMMADVIEKMDESLYFFIVTTLSKGQLKIQIDNELKKYTKKDNFLVYGLSDYTKNTIIQEEDILKLLPTKKQIIWFRDEGHINTNRWAEILNNRSDKIVNFSATNNRNSEDDIRCNFNHTMMLRTVKQQEGTPKDAINKLLEIKKQHEKVKNYNPCAIFRVLDDSLLDEVIGLCERNHLKWINITEEDYIMKEICEDNNIYDVIINKFKIVEGIDIRRAHVLFMTNEPKNPATTIQVIGRCRRNALLYREDIDILDSKNNSLLEHTRNCYVFYNVKGMNISEDINGDLVTAFCDTISVEQLKPNISIKLKKGYLKNGLRILESKTDNNYLSGNFDIKKDRRTGFNVLSSKETKLKYYNSRKINCCFKEKKYYINCGGIMSEDDLYIGYHPNYIKTSVPLKEVSKNWFINKEDNKIFYRNYGESTATIRINIDEADLVDKSNELKRDYSLTVFGDNKNKYCILLYYTEGYNYVLNHFYKRMRFYNVDLKTFCEEKNKTVFDTKTQAEEQLGLITEEMIKVFLEKILFCVPYKIESYDDSIEIIERDFDFRIEKKYVGISYLHDKYLYFYYDYRKKQIYDIQYKNNYKRCSINGELSLENTELNRKDYLLDIKISFSQPNYNQLEVYEEDLNYSELQYFNYYIKYNDKESAIIGGDLMKYVSSKSTDIFIEDSSVTSKINKFTKFRIFLTRKYSDILEKSKEYFFNGNNQFSFSKKCNSMLGYLVEYYTKYLFYGSKYLSRYIYQAKKEAKGEASVDDIVIRACMNKYKDLMVDAFGASTASVVGSKMMTIAKLVEEQFIPFKQKIIELAKNCIDIVRDNIILYENNMIHDPNLSISHIAGLADIIDENTIMDIKCTSTINEKSILQLLGYYYLSTKRTDLNIKNLMVLDAVTKRYIKINIESGEVTSNYEKTI